MLKSAIKARVANSHAGINSVDVTDVLLTSDSAGNIVATAVMAPNVQSADVAASVASLKGNSSSVSIGSKSFAASGTTDASVAPPVEDDDDGISSLGCPKHGRP